MDEGAGAELVDEPEVDGAGELGGICAAGRRDGEDKDRPCERLLVLRLRVKFKV